MEITHMFTPANVIAACLALFPFLAAAFFPLRFAGRARNFPAWLQLSCPTLLSLPYVLVTYFAGIFRWEWFALYAALPAAVALLLSQAARTDKAQRGTWMDFLVLAALGLAVDLRWFEAAWPPHLAIFNKVLLLDAGIYGFILIRNLDGTGFDLRLRLRDAAIGLREFAIYTPIALALGLAHFNKRAVHFNWRYVLLATIAGIFYGRAWRQHRRVAASAITHASVDAVWSLWLH